LLAVLLLGGAFAVVQAQERSTVTKLHEDLQPPKAQAARTADRLAEGIPVIGPAPEAMQNPTAIASQDKLLPKPSTSKDEASSDGEPVHGRNDFGVDRQTETKPDYRTSADNELKYIEVFNPSIVPFKRMTALDSVREDYTLYSSQRGLLDVPIGGMPRANHDLFWASILVDLKPGLDVPIPSVSPGMRVLSYESNPTTTLVFSKDGADNFYLRTDEIGAGGTYRVVFSVEANPYYFAPTTPPRLRIKDIPDDRIRPLPAKVQRVAEGVLDEMRLHRGMLAKAAIDKLVYYFRSFDAKSPPPNSGDVYLDLYNSQAGVCRHRSFAFMVTANALGIPTRYVANEAHAWVEVWLPKQDWMRIDLGGAASTLNVENAADKSMYRPRSEDPFSKPESYSENYTRLEGDVKGLRDDQIEERQTPYEGGDGGDPGQGSFFGNDEESAFEESEDEGPLTGPGADLPTIPEEELAGKKNTYVAITSSSSDGYRGDMIDVAGVVYGDEREGLAGHRVNIYLAPAGTEGRGSLHVGSTISDGDGRFAVEVEVPTSLDTARYEIFAGTQGNAEYRPSVYEY
jgi:hypothetical protein